MQYGAVLHVAVGRSRAISQGSSMQRARLHYQCSRSASRQQRKLLACEAVNKKNAGAGVLDRIYDAGFGRKDAAAGAVVLYWTRTHQIAAILEFIIDRLRK
jgi:hypothetical protein